MPGLQLISCDITVASLQLPSILCDTVWMGAGTSPVWIIDGVIDGAVEAFFDFLNSYQPVAPSIDVNQAHMTSQVPDPLLSIEFTTRVKCVD